MKWKWKCVLVNITSNPISHSLRHFYRFYCRYLIFSFGTLCLSVTVSINEKGVAVAMAQIASAFSKHINRL